MGSQQSQQNWIRGVVKQFAEGDKVEVRAGNKTRTLTVTGPARYVERAPYRYNGYLVNFEGYGTEYELEIPDDSSGIPPLLTFPSSPATGYPVRDVSLAGETDFGIVAEKTASDLGIPER